MIPYHFVDKTTWLEICEISQNFTYRWLSVRKTYLYSALTYWSYDFLTLTHQYMILLISVVFMCAVSLQPPYPFLTNGKVRYTGVSSVELQHWIQMRVALWLVLWSEAIFRHVIDLMMALPQQIYYYVILVSFSRFVVNHEHMVSVIIWANDG